MRNVFCMTNSLELASPLIPWDIVLNIRRSKEINHEWIIGEFLEQLWKELVIRSATEVRYHPIVERKREEGFYQSIVPPVCTVLEII